MVLEAARAAIPHGMRKFQGGVALSHMPANNGCPGVWGCYLEAFESVIIR
jgi:hypothetical protein